MTHQDDFLRAYDEECCETLEDVENKDAQDVSEEVEEKLEEIEINSEYSCNFSDFYAIQVVHRNSKIQPEEETSNEDIQRKLLEEQEKTEEISNEKSPVWVISEPIIYKSPLKIGRVLLGVLALSTAIFLTAMITLICD